MPPSAEDMLNGDVDEWTSLSMPDLLKMTPYRKHRERISAEAYRKPPSLPSPGRQKSVKGVNLKYWIVCFQHLMPANALRTSLSRKYEQPPIIDELVTAAIIL